MRLFVALDISVSVRDQLAAFQRQMRPFAPTARWVRQEGMHVTLKFLGDQTSEQLEAIIHRLRSVTVVPISFSVSGLGFFPNVKMARVFWAGVEGAPELATLSSAVNQVLTGIDIAEDEQPFHPHITLARIGSAKPHRDSADQANQNFAPLQKQLLKIPRPEFGTITAREFFLYESKLGPDGSIYTKRESFPLNEALAPSAGK